MNHENSIRKRVQALKSFYTNLVIYAAVCVACIIIWVSLGGGAFWPIWVIFGCGLSAILQGVTLGQIPQLQDLFPFLNPEWEEEQVEELTKKIKDNETPEQSELLISSSEEKSLKKKSIKH